MISRWVLEPRDPTVIDLAFEGSGQQPGTDAVLQHSEDEAFDVYDAEGPIFAEALAKGSARYLACDER